MNNFLILVPIVIYLLAMLYIAYKVSEIKNNAKSFSDTLHECDKCIISVEIDEITAIDDNTYDIYIRLINTFNDSVRSEFPLRLVAGYHTKGLSVRVEPYLKSNFVK